MEICYQDTSFPSLEPPTAYPYLVLSCMDVFAPIPIVKAACPRTHCYSSSPSRSPTRRAGAGAAICLAAGWRCPASWRPRPHRGRFLVPARVDAPAHARDDPAPPDPRKHPAPPDPVMAPRHRLPTIRARDVPLRYPALAGNARRRMAQCRATHASDSGAPLALVLWVAARPPAQEAAATAAHPPVQSCTGQDE